MITVLVPVLNEEENVTPLLQEIAEVSNIVPCSEIIYVDDGSTDKTVDMLKELRKDYPMLRIVQHDKRCGQSAALWTGVKSAGNDIIVTLDGDGQNNPADIALLYKTFSENERNNTKLMVVGERIKRNDNWVRRVSSRFANRVRSGLLKDKTRDTGCSLKMFRRKDYLSLPYFDHMHRFLPALMMRENVQIMHVGVSHRPRQYGTSKYGTLDRLLVGISDLWGVWWLLRRPYAYPRIFEELN